MRERQRHIINELGVLPTIDPVAEIQDRTNFLADYLSAKRLGGLVLGISGGQDSLLAGILAQRAVEKQRARGEDATFHAVLLPYGSQADRDDAILALSVIRPDKKYDVDILPGVDAIVASLASGLGEDIRDFDKGNIKARVRMISQYAIASSKQSLVVGTDHAAEAVMGFFTKYGDGGADILPLSGLTKRQGRQLLRELGAPERFMTKAPTADLLDGNPQQADEAELGVTYDIIDGYLEGYDVNDETAAIIEDDHYEPTRHKRELPVAYVRKNTDTMDSDD